MLKIYHLLIIILLISITVIASDDYLLIEGITGILKDNIIAQISNLQLKKSIFNKDSFLKLEKVIRDSLKALGYYEPCIKFYIRSSSTNHNITIVHIEPGKPILIGPSNIILRNDAKTDSDYIELLNKIPNIGTILNHGHYDDFKKSLNKIAINKGYFDSKFNKSQLKVSLKKHQAYWDIDFDSGKRYHFGDFNFDGSHIKNDYLINLIPFKENDFYDLQKIIKLKRKLLMTEWFDSVIIESSLNKSNYDKKLNLYGILSPKVKNSIEIGLGYSSNIGACVKTSWKKPWINSNGHSFKITSNISTFDKQLTFNYKIPLLKDPIEHFFLVKGNLQFLRLNNTQFKLEKFSISRHWELPKSWKRSINLNLDSNFLKKTKLFNKTVLLYPSIIISNNKSHDSLMPKYGNLQYYVLEYSNTIWRSSFNFLKLQTQNIWIKTIYDKYRFIIRNNINIIKYNKYKIAKLGLNNLYFFDKNYYYIRGYNYESIIPNAKCNNYLPNNNLVTSSLEIQNNIIGNWWSAIFVDIGEQLKNFKHKDLKIGLGCGIRLQSLIGPIKLDLALPMNNKKHDLQLYISLGPEI